jgi:hypothetical protein
MEKLDLLAIKESELTEAIMNMEALTVETM